MPDLGAVKRDEEMKLGEFRKMVEHLPDDWELCFHDPNFGGIWEGHDITKEDVKVLLRQLQRKRTL